MLSKTTEKFGLPRKINKEKNRFCEYPQNHVQNMFLILTGFAGATHSGIDSLSTDNKRPVLAVKLFNMQLMGLREFLRRLEK